MLISLNKGWLEQNDSSIKSTSVCTCAYACCFLNKKYKKYLVKFYNDSPEFGAIASLIPVYISA